MKKPTRPTPAHSATVPHDLAPNTLAKVHGGNSVALNAAIDLLDSVDVVHESETACFGSGPALASGSCFPR